MKVTDRVMVLHTGSIGDTLMIIPALRLVKAKRVSPHVTLICDRNTISGQSVAKEILDPTGLVDEFLFYRPAGRGRRGSTAFSLIALLIQLARRRSQPLLYAVRHASKAERLARIRQHRLFFHIAGIRRVIGLDGPWYDDDNVVQRPAVADQLIRRLLGELPPEVERAGLMNLSLTEKERFDASCWIERHVAGGPKKFVAFGVGGKSQVNHWPISRYIEIGIAVCNRFDVWPIVFGGREDKQDADIFVRSVGKGTVAAGELGIRSAAAVLEKCCLYIGNDTGTIHLAAAAGVPCVGIYSAHAPLGEWYPYGEGHCVLRKRMACEGCGLRICEAKGAECIMSIGTDEVWTATMRLLQKGKIAPRG